MAGLGFSSGGDFKPYIAYNAKSGKWSMKKDGVDTEVEKPTFVIGFDTIKTGYMYFATGQAPQYAWNPSLSQKIPRPEGVGADGKPNFKEGFAVDLFSNKHFGGVVEFCSSSMIVRDAINVLYTAYEEGKSANPGKLPVVESNGTTKVVGRHGTNYSPNFKITSWVDKPVEFSQSAPANQSAEAPPAPARSAVSEF